MRTRCPACGELTAAHRHYCRECDADLLTDIPPVRLHPRDRVRTIADDDAERIGRHLVDARKAPLMPEDED